MAKEAALKAVEIAEEMEDLEEFFREVFVHAEATLAKTPEMLPVLKEAGVVDSGGQGLLEVFRGAVDGFLGKEVDYSQFEKSAKTPEMLPVLKEAGVVDSGGQGLLEVFRGAVDGFLGKEVDYSQFEKSASPSVTKISPQAEADIKFGYCTEFISVCDKNLSSGRGGY